MTGAMKSNVKIMLKMDRGGSSKKGSFLVSHYNRRHKIVGFYLFKVCLSACDCPSRLNWVKEVPFHVLTEIGFHIIICVCVKGH